MALHAWQLSSTWASRGTHRVVRASQAINLPHRLPEGAASPTAETGACMPRRFRCRSTVYKVSALSRTPSSTAINSFCPSAHAPMSMSVHSRSSESRTLKCTPSAPHVHVIALQAALAKLPVLLLPDRHPRLLLVDRPLVDPRCRTSRVPAPQVMPRARPVPSGPPAAGFGVACLVVACRSR
jgi:hypothetical protein